MSVGVFIWDLVGGLAVNELVSDLVFGLVVSGCMGSFLVSFVIALVGATVVGLLLGASEGALGNTPVSDTGVLEGSSVRNFVGVIGTNVSGNVGEFVVLLSSVTEVLVGYIFVDLVKLLVGDLDGASIILGAWILSLFVGLFVGGFVVVMAGSLFGA